MACNHCGFRGVLDEKARGVLERKEAYDDHGGTYSWERSVCVRSCPHCDGITVDTYWEGDSIDPEDVEVIVLYPQATPDLSALPDRVREQYEDAYKVRGISPNFYAVGVRRTLEAVCTERGFPRVGGESLFDRLDKLAKSGRLPDVFVDMASHLRALGNLGAHADDVDVEPADIEVAADFAEAILEYLYRAPARVARVTAGLADRRAAAKMPKETP